MAKKTPSPVDAPVPDLKWQTEDDHRTLLRAAEIMADAKRLGRVRSLQTQTATAMGRLLATRKLGGQLKRA